jgi:uncharacterized membrane protein
MEQNWKLITEWNNLVPEKKLTATFALIVMALVSVIIYYESKLIKVEINYKKELKQEKEGKDEILKKHIQYIEKSEREYRDIVLDIQKLKNK